MRTIKVKPGISRYQLVSDDGKKLGWININLRDKVVGIAVLKRLDDIEKIGIEVTTR